MGVRTLHIAATANGASWMHEMLRELKARGHDVSAVIAGGHGSLAPKLERDGIPYHVLDLDVLAFRKGPAIAATIVRLARLLRRVRPDVVHCHLFPSMVIGRMAGWLADAPVRVSMSPSPYYLEAPVLGDIDADTAWMDTRVIASCELTRTLYEQHGVPRDHVGLVYYGADARTFDPSRADGARVRRELGIAPARPVVGMVAYFYPPLRNRGMTPPRLIDRGIKGHDVLIRAVPGVLARVPDAVFVLVGEGWGAAGREYEAQLQALAQELGVAHAVRFTGARADVADALAAFDVAVQCSLSENLGGSIEALLMARPLVVTSVGGLVDSVRHEDTGLLVPPDDPDALAAALVRLLQDRPLAARLASAGHRFALERFTLARTVDDLEAEYAAGVRAVQQGRTAPAHALRYRWSRTAVRAVALPFHLGRLLLTFLRTRGRPDPTGRAPHVIQVAGATENAEWFVDICRRLRDAGYEVSAVIGHPEGPLAARLRDIGISYTAVTLSFSPELGRARVFVYLLRVPLAIWRLRSIFRRSRATVVHAHIFNTVFITRIAAWLARVPIRVSMLPGPLHLDAPLTRAADRLTWWMDHRVVAGSGYTRNRYRALGLRPPRLTFIPYGADPNRFDPARADGPRVRRELGLDAGAPLVGLIAYFYPPRQGWQTPPRLRDRGIKGHEDIIAAAHVIRRRRPDARFVLVGGGWGDAGERYRQRLIARCRDEGLGEAVTFTGYRADVPDVLAALTVAVQCSLSENYGGTVESLMMEVPTVATNVGGMPETVVHERTGLIVPPSDPAALAGAIVALIESPDRAREMAREGRRYMLERFQCAGTATSIDRMYQELLVPAERR